MQAILGGSLSERMDKKRISSAVVKYAKTKEVMAFFECSEWHVRAARIHAEVGVQQATALLQSLYLCKRLHFACGDFILRISELRPLLVVPLPTTLNPYI